ncbi:MAG: hypothetical protein DI586_01545 [Micavibrio aeruginosavorus]|uniref:Uncharacterized protein n=1 Tax=Micavibrio aeruginosavorus TaxID=349221 RepID=A0A2W5HFW8_9BACT|nr:MAG: hypothetical protein DI586_01545 [Micavibrio aeruginosavorus]
MNKNLSIAAAAALAATAMPSYSQENEASPKSTEVGTDVPPDIEESFLKIMADQFVPYRFISAIPDQSLTITVEHPSKTQGEFAISGTKYSTSKISLKAAFFNRKDQSYQVMGCEELSTAKLNMLKIGITSKTEFEKAVVSAQISQLDIGVKALNCPPEPMI